MIHFDGVNLSGCQTYDSLTFCEIIFGGPTGGPTGGLRFQVSALRSHVSGVRSQKLMLSLTRFARFVTHAIAYQIFNCLTDTMAYQIFTFLSDAMAYQIFTFFTDATVYQILT